MGGVGASPFDPISDLLLRATNPKILTRQRKDESLAPTTEMQSHPRYLLWVTATNKFLNLGGDLFSRGTLPTSLTKFDGYNAYSYYAQIRHYLTYLLKKTITTI